HVMDIYDHYRFRYVIQKQGTNAFSGLEPDDKWQDKYFDTSNPASHDADVWFDADDKGNVTPPGGDAALAPSTKRRAPIQAKGKSGAAHGATKAPRVHKSTTH